MALRILVRIALMGALLVGQVTAALAANLYAAQVSSTLTITGFFDAGGTAIAKPSDLLVEGDAEVFDRFALALGAASADTLVLVDVFGSDPLDLDVGEGVALVSLSGGTLLDIFEFSDTNRGRWSLHRGRHLGRQWRSSCAD